MQQSTLVAAIVVITFALGFMSGRATAPSTPSAPPSPMAAAPAAPTPFPAAVPQAVPSSPPSSDAVSGQLAEVIQVPSYTYLRISTPHGDEWAAVSSNPQLTVGQHVALGHANRMESFASKT